MRCDRCSAENNKLHPAGGFKVQLEEVTFDDKPRILCQKCKVRTAIKAGDNTEAESLRLSIKNLISKLF